MLKGFTKFLFAGGLIIVSISLIVEMKYNLSVPKYLAYSAPLTQEEQKYLKEKEILIYGINTDNAPFISNNKQSGEPEGLIVDYMNFISKDLGIKLVYQTINPKDSVDKIRKKDIDIIEVFNTSEAGNEYGLTQSIYQVEGEMVTKYVNRDIKSYHDMQGKRLAIVAGKCTEDAIIEAMPKGQKMNFRYVSSIKEGLSLLMNNEVDAVAGDKLAIDYYSEELSIKNDLRRVGQQLYKGNIALGLNIYDTKLNNILNKELVQLKKKNLYGSAQEEWMGISAPMVTGSSSIKWAQWIMLFCVSIVILLMLWESILNRKIDQQTRQIKIEKNNLQTVINNIKALVAVINQNDDIVNCNHYGKEMLGDKGDSLEGCSVSIVPMLADLLKEYRKNPGEPYYLYKEKYYRVSVSKLKSSKVNFLLMIEDCTTQTIAERNIRQESKMIAVGQLSAGLAHEIRNPLGLIKSYSYILKDYADDEMAEHALNVINDSANRIDRLIENLLSFSRLSNDKPTKLNAVQLFNNIIELEKKKVEKQNVIICFECAKELIVYTMEETIKLVAFNLLDNAVEAFREAGQNDGNIDITVEIEEENLKFSIKDNGPGMEEETVENIFNPFFSTKDTGTGLGLYIVITELEKVNGHIEVKSQKGKGTEFIVRIPIYEQE